MKRIAILGSTGSIGVNALDVVKRYPQNFKVVALTAYSNISLLCKQIVEYHPSYVCVSKREIPNLKKQVGDSSIVINDAEEGISELVKRNDIDIVILGMSGSAALEPFLNAVKAGKTVAPANKEALVIAGDIIIKEAQRSKAKIIPVDSEQSAIFQCLDGRKRSELKRVYLTASGGALYNIPRTKFDKLGIDEILNHPRWKMGKKITVDSANLMNKGFEVIEAIRLFNLRVDDIEVLIHPEAVIHSMVSFKDGAVFAQLGITDMRLPIQYALTYPERWDTGLRDIDFLEIKKLTFLEPDYEKFPALALAIRMAKLGGTYPCVLNAADEEAVAAFLKGDLSFTQIYTVVEKVISRHKSCTDHSHNLKDIWMVDSWAREEAKRTISQIRKRVKETVFV